MLRPLAAAVFCALTLTACPDAPEPPPDPCDLALASVGPERSEPEAPLERWPMLQTDSWATPRGPWQGGGRAWQAKVGGASSDYPGPAALIAPTGHPAAQLTLVDRRELTADACALRPDGSDDWLGVAVPLRIGGPGSCSDEETCWAEVETLLDAGASLVLAHPGAYVSDGPTLLPRLGWRVRRRVAHGGVLHQLAVAVPARREGLLQRAEQAHLVLLDGPALDLFASGELRLQDAVIRATGRRPVLAWPFTSASGARPPGEDVDLVVAGLHLALGGALLVQGPEPLPPRVEAARSWLRTHPELVHRSSSSLQLYFDPQRPGGAELAALGRGLDVAHVPWEVAVRPPGGLAPSTLERERLHNAPLLALSDVGLLPELRDAMPEQGRHLEVAVAATHSCRPALEQAVASAPGQLVAVSGDGALHPESQRFEAARVETDLPTTVQIVRSVAPHRGVTVHHLLDGRVGPDGRATEVPPSTLVAGARPGLGDRATCRATWHLPAEQRSEQLPCEVLDDDRIEVRLPAFRAWAVLSSQLLPEDRGQRFGERAIRIQEPGPTWPGTTVSLEVPFLSSELLTTLSLPEWLRAGGGELVAFETMQHTSEVAPDGSRAVLVSEAPGLRFERELQAGYDRVDLKITVTNLGPDPLPDVAGLICVATTGASPFPESGHGGTWILDGDQTLVLGDLPVDDGDPLYREETLPAVGERVAPLTILRSVDDRYSLGTGYEGSDVVGGNGARGGVCQHARPWFGDVAPGASVSRRGVVWITEDGPPELARRWVQEFGAIQPVPGPTTFEAARPVCGDEPR